VSAASALDASKRRTKTPAAPLTPPFMPCAPLCADARTESMSTITRVLAPVDFSAGSKAALDWALTFADRFKAQLQILHVWDVPVAMRPDLMVWFEGGDQQPLESVILRQATEEMAGFLAELPESSRARVDARIERGSPVHTILNIAKSEGFDLLVMGTHGRTGLGHVLMGSVTERVIRQAPCPVLTVRIAEPKKD
jgi:nucleotide-binding universal stress UspA family protein